MRLLPRRGITGGQFGEQRRDINDVPANPARVPSAYLCGDLRRFMFAEVVFLRPDVFRSAFGVGSVIKMLIRGRGILVRNVPGVVLGDDLGIPIPLHIRINVYRRMHFYFLQYGNLDQWLSSYGNRRRNSHCRVNLPRRCSSLFRNFIVVIFSWGVVSVQCGPPRSLLWVYYLLWPRATLSPSLFDLRPTAVIF